MKMKRYCVPVICVLVTSMLCILTACNTSPETPAQVVEQNKNSEPEQAQTSPEQVQTTVVSFTDSVLETIVRASIGKPSGDITSDDVKSVTRLDLSNDYQRYISDEAVIKDINGLEYFTGLEILDLSSHQVSDLTPLKELHKLKYLILEDNPITDISPLSNLSSLQLLVLSSCKAVDYTPLANLINLQYLKLDNSTITDITPLI